MELEIIKNSIHEIRGKKVMLDMDLVIFYENAYVKSKVYMAVDKCETGIFGVGLLSGRGSKFAKRTHKKSWGFFHYKTIFIILLLICDFH